MSKQSVFSADKMTATLMRRSFFDFVKEMWSTVNPGRKPVWNWHIEYLCNHLQANAERVFLNLPKLHDTLINVPPGTTKSTICSQMFPAWIWSRMPNAVIICGSYSESLALDHSRKTRIIIESDAYRRLFPDIKIGELENTAAKFTLETGGRRAAYGTGSGVTGVHADFIIVDDPISAQDANSDAERQKACIWMTETLSTRKKDKDVAHTCVVMQRLHEADPAGDMIARATNLDGEVVGLEWICLPAEDSDDVRPASARAFYVDGLLDPIRLSAATLEAQRNTLGQYGYAGQFEQRPSMREGSLFKNTMLQAGPQPRPEDFTEIVRHWDKAGTKGAGAWSVGALLGKHKNGKTWILDIKRGRWSTEERETHIVNVARIDRLEYGAKLVVSLEQEGGSGGKESVEATVGRLAGYTVVAEKPVGDKFTRALPFSVQYNYGNVYYPHNGRDPNWLRPMKDEFQSFPSGRYKDQVDACSGAFAQLHKPRRRCGGLW